MQPKTSVRFDRTTFQRMKTIIRNKGEILRSRGQQKSFAVPLPREIGIQLTRKCNLRCRHCYQWNAKGLFTHAAADAPAEELDLGIIARVLRDTAAVKSNLYLWGGEPLLYSRWGEMSEIMTRDPRWTVICTNGLLIGERLEHLLKISRHLTLLISVDGLQAAHDQIRGRGVFARVIRNIRELLQLQKKGIYQGLISIYCVLHSAVIPRMYEFAEYCEALGIDSLYFGFPWYIPPAVAERMDAYFRRLSPGGKAPAGGYSWHSYTYCFPETDLEMLCRQMDALCGREWKMRIRLQPALNREEVRDYLYGAGKPAQNRRICLATSSRIDINADGTAGPCKFFPELSMGNLHEQSLGRIWQSPEYAEFRRSVSRGLMPVCAKCVLLYLHGC